MMGRAISAYGLMIVLGTGAGAIVGLVIVHYNSLSVDDFILCATYTAIGGFAGAKVLYLYIMRNVIEWTRIFDFQYFQEIMSGGFAFYGVFLAEFSL